MKDLTSKGQHKQVFFKSKTGINMTSRIAMKRIKKSIKKGIVDEDA